MKLIYAGPHPLPVTLVVEGEQVEHDGTEPLDVPPDQARQLIAQGWAEASPAEPSKSKNPGGTGKVSS